MKAMIDLFSTDYGVMSLLVIVFLLGMMVWFFRLFTNMMDDSSKSAKDNPPGASH